MSSEALPVPRPILLPLPRSTAATSAPHAATAAGLAAVAQEPKDTPVAPTPSTPGTTGTTGTTGAPGPQGDPGATGQTGTGQPGQAPGIGDACGANPLLMMGLFLVVMWLLVLRPESKRRKEQSQMMASLQVGDRVVTLGGMHGTVAALSDKTVTLRVDDVRMVFDRSAVGRIERDTPAATTDGKTGKDAKS